MTGSWELYAETLGCDPRSLAAPSPAPVVESEIRVGDRVRERAWRVPEGCQPFVARAEFVADDGWVCVKLGPRSFSFAPHEIEKVEEVD